MKLGSAAIMSGAVMVMTSPAWAEGGGGAAPLLPTLIPMQEIAVPIIDAGNIKGVLRFTLVLRAHDAATAAELTDKQPLLRSAALGAGLEFAQIRASPYAPVDVSELVDTMNHALHAANPAIEQALVVRVMATEK